MEEMGVIPHCHDPIPKEREWKQQYEVIDCYEGNDNKGEFSLYTDGSKLGGNSGYGAVLFNKENEIVQETWGSRGHCIPG